jgi:hypothetical protein
MWINFEDYPILADERQERLRQEVIERIAQELGVVAGF